MPTKVIRVAEGAIPDGADGKLTVGYWYVGGRARAVRSFSRCLGTCVYVCHQYLQLSLSLPLSFSGCPFVYYSACMIHPGGPPLLRRSLAQAVLT